VAGGCRSPGTGLFTGLMAVAFGIEAGHILQCRTEWGVDILLRKIFLLLCILLFAACGEYELPSPYHAIDVTRLLEKADFHLADFNGKPRSLAEFRGKVVVLFFGYTHCPVACPTTLADLAQAMRMLGKDANRVQVLFVTVDPERDTPELLAKFVPYFDPSFLGLYGDAQATAQTAKAFGVSYEKLYYKKGGYAMNHADGTYLIGTKGRPMLLSRYGQPTELLVQDIRLLLATDR
jgi:protein SCO1